MATEIAATDQTRTAVTPRIKLLSHGFSIDHPDPELGEQLMADALGVADRDAMHGILRQLVRASVKGQKPDAVNLAFMIGGACRSHAVRGKKRCRMHGGAPGSGAPRGNRNARKHGLFTRDAIAERRRIQALLGEARKFLQGMK